MSISAVYKKGVIRPMEKLDLAENERIEIEIKEEGRKPCKGYEVRWHMEKRA